MKDIFILKLLDKFSFMFTRVGIDYKLMRKILQLKLTLDSRRTTTIMNNKKSDNKEKNQFINSLFMYGLLGLFIGLFIFMPMPLFMKMNFMLGMIIFMIMATMISDFSTVLLDIKDKNILLPRPIDSRAINAAKLVHIFIYLLSITIAFSGIALILAIVKYGVLFALIFLFQLILISGFVIFFTSILYFFILSMFDGEKLKDIINYFQILLSIFLTIGYQFMGRIFNLFDYDIAYVPKWWHYLMPSTWFAAPYSLIFEGNKSAVFIILTCLSIAIPVGAFILYFKVITPYFEKNLQKLSQNNERIKRSREKKVKRQRKLASFFTFSKAENTFFRFTQNMLSNERKLKLSIYPSLAFSVIMPFIFMASKFGRGKNFSQVLSDIRNGNSYLFIYFSIIMLGSVVSYVSRSEKYKGAWIYKTLPIERPADIFKGSIKAALLMLVIPVYLIITILFLSIFGLKILLDLSAIFLSILLLIMLIFKLSKKQLPFHKDFALTKGNEEGTLTLMFGSMAYSGACTGIHYCLTKLQYGVLIYSIILLLLFLLLWSTSFKFGWKDI
jgi:hypothetical protein